MQNNKNWNTYTVNKLIKIIGIFKMQPENLKNI